MPHRRLHRPSGTRQLALTLAADAARATLTRAALCAFAATPALAASDADASTPRLYVIAAAPLGDVLAQYAAMAGVQLVFQPAVLADRRSSGLQGRYTVQAGLEVLLRGSGYEPVAQGSGGYSLRKVAVAPDGRASRSDEPTMLPPVKVKVKAERDATESLQQEGSASDGYRSTTASSVGALGSKVLLDTPFSISVLPRELIQNVQAQSPDDLYKLNPSTRTNVPQSTGWSPMVSIRGLGTYDTAEDGLRRPYNHAAVTEDKERVEVLNGLSGFLYGAAAPGGMINYVYKRPTFERLTSITVGNYGGGQYFLHGDFGGRLDEAGSAGYRLNIVKQDGKTAIDDQKIDRSLISGAIDWQLSDSLLLELNAAYNHYKTEGPAAYWYYEVPHGAPPDASKLWSQPWIRDEFNNTKLMGKLTYRLNDQITLRGAYMRDYIERPIQDHAMNDVTLDTEYSQIRIRSGKTKDTFDAAQALADITFDTGPVAHKMTVGYTMYSDKSWSTSYSPNTGWLGPYPLTTPTYVPEAAFPADTTSPYYAGQVRNTNILIGDSISLGKHWSVLLGLNRSRIFTESLDATGAKLQPDYDQSRSSPSLSLAYKPAPWLTTYVSYIEGLEQGGTAPDTASNNGSVMPPMVSKQSEIGIKAQVGGLLLTSALFQIEKAYEYTNGDNKYTQNGRQNHKGIEFTATGKLLDRWTIVGGATVLNARVHGGDFDGKEPVNVATVLAKLYSEYELAALPGLSLTGGVYRTGRQWADDANTDRLPSYTTVDLGMRYAARLSGRATTLRLSVSNVANKNYWLNSYYVGPPRSVALSAQMQF